MEVDWGAELWGVIVSVAPLVILLLFIKAVLIRSRFENKVPMLMGIIFCLLGLLIFMRGVNWSLVPLADDIGQGLGALIRPGNSTAGLLTVESDTIINSESQATSTDIATVNNETTTDEAVTTEMPANGTVTSKIATGQIRPRTAAIGEVLGLGSYPLLFLCVFLIGLAATMVEPGLQTIANQAEEVSAGAIRKRTLIIITALGFGCGSLLGTIKIVYGIDIYWILAPMLLAAIPMLRFASPTFSALAFDCSGAAVGPVNIPVNVAIAIGLSRAVGADALTAGFGIVGLTFLGAALAILAFSVVTRV